MGKQIISLAFMNLEEPRIYFSFGKLFKNAHKVDQDLLLPESVIHDACIVDEDVQRLEFGHHSVDSRLKLRLVGDVTLDELQAVLAELGAQSSHGLLAGSHAHVQDSHFLEQRHYNLIYYSA